MKRGLVATSVMLGALVLGIAGFAASATGVVSAVTLPGGGLPLGDGHTTTAGPKATWVFACMIPGGGGGASGATPWIDGTRWYPALKPRVSGSVTWSQASLKVSASGATRTITTMGVPTTQVTGTFPISQSDPVYVYDNNPNSIKPTSVTVSVPRYPKVAASASCLPMGPIGYTRNGVAIFNALDGENRDAAAHEMLDTCDGHPERTGQYHYHSGSRCILRNATASSTRIGYALDGFGIYVERDADGKLLTNADLDACHGRTSTVMFNGVSQRMYHYVITRGYPYTLGCFRGTPTTGTAGTVSR